MTTEMQDLLNQLQDQLQAMLADRSRREELAYQSGYRQCLKDAHLQLAALDSYQPAEPTANTMMANGGDTVGAPSLSPVYARAAKYIADHPGSTRREIMEYGSVRGKKVIDMLVARGLVRRDTLPVSKRKPREAYVRYYPA